MKETETGRLIQCPECTKRFDVEDQIDNGIKYVSCPLCDNQFHVLDGRPDLSLLDMAIKVSNSFGQNETIIHELSLCLMKQPVQGGVVK